jgi:aryl-alcohol dehydrogenase-like predicted oxidoreductase
MARVSLGRTGISVGRVGLGTVKLGRTAGLKYPAPVVIPDDQAALALLRAAHESGVNLIDTAPAYGSSETRLGTLLPQVAPRDRWVICTKAGERFDPAAEQGRGRSTWDFSPAALTQSVEQSLRALRTDRLDLVLLHFASSFEHEHAVIRSGEALAALARLRDQGKVRAIGASCAQVGAALDALAVCDVLMLTWNPQEQAMAPVIAAAPVRRVGVLVKKALASGHLGSESPAADPSANHPSSGDTLAWVLGTPGVDAVVLGTTRPDRLREAALLARGG